MNKKPKITHECLCLKHGALRSICRGPQGCQADMDRVAYEAYLESKKPQRWVWKKPTIQFVSELTDQEAKQLLFDIYERIPIAGEDLSYSALPDKITRYVNEANRLSSLEEAVTQYIVEECCNENIGVQDPINFLLASHRMLRHNIHAAWKEEYR